MSFARYNGPEEHGLIRGKAYLGKDAMGGSAAGAGMSVFMRKAWTTGANSNTFQKNVFLHVTEEGLERWKVAEKAYAVVLKEKLEDWKRGEVVVVTDWTDDGKLEVEGLGYVAADGLDILDRTNVTPGIRVMEYENGNWKRVVAVDDALWVRVNGTFKSPEEFVFPVSWDGDLLSEPLVTCLKTEWTFNRMEGLTEGKRYYLEETIKAGIQAMDTVVLVGDDGQARQYPAELFRMG
jgi:hypothetical protein